MYSSASVFCKFERSSKGGTLTRDEVDSYLPSERIAFYSYLSNTLYHIGSSCDTQILYRNIVTEARGLSKSGRHLLARLGFIPETTYQRRIKQILTSHEELIRL